MAAAAGKVKVPPSSHPPTHPPTHQHFPQSQQLLGKEGWVSLLLRLRWLGG